VNPLTKSGPASGDETLHRAEGLEAQHGEGSPEGNPAPPGPGVYEDVPAEVYHSWPYASNSRLGKLVPPSTPRKLREYLDEPAKGTKAMREGRILHAAVLEPDVYKRDYVRSSQCIAQTGKGGQCKNDGAWPLKGGKGSVCTTHLEKAARDGMPYDIDTDLVIVSDTDHAMVHAVRESIAQHPRAGAFLRSENAITELSIVWDDPHTGVRCKARWDWYDRFMVGGTIMDLKGARDASVEGFRKDGFWNGYHRQGTLYLMGARELDLPVHHFALLAAEKVAPFDLTIHRITETLIGYLPRRGEEPTNCARQMHALLRLWDKCQRTGEYPGYSEDVQDFELREWQWSTMDEQTRLIEEMAA